VDRECAQIDLDAAVIFADGEIDELARQRF
jgi:hypothetical protein